MPSACDLTLAHYTSAEATELMDELCDAYADAYGAVPGEDPWVKTSAFRERARLASNAKATGMHVLYGRWGWRKMGIVPGKPGAYYSEYARFVLPLPLTTAGQ